MTQIYENPYFWLAVLAAFLIGEYAPEFLLGDI